MAASCDKAAVIATHCLQSDMTLMYTLHWCAQGESQEAAHCCEKSELQALAVRCVGAWEVRRILGCGAELQPPARHAFILRVRCPAGPHVRARMLGGPLQRGVFGMAATAWCPELLHKSAMHVLEGRAQSASVRAAVHVYGVHALGIWFVKVSASAHRGKGRSMLAALTSAWRCSCTQVRMY